MVVVPARLRRTLALHVQTGRRNKGAVVKGNTATKQSLETHFGGLFKGSVSNSMSCSGMPTSSMMESFSVLGLVLSGRRERLSDALKRYFLPEVLPDYQTARGSKVQAKKQPHFVDVPKARLSLDARSSAWRCAHCSTTASVIAPHLCPH